VRIATKSAHTGAVVALERAGKLAVRSRIARTLKIDKEDGTTERCREETRTLASNGCHGARTARWSERKEELAFRIESGEPCRKRMRCAGADDNDVDWIERTLCAVGVNEGDLRPWLKRDARASRECFVDFDGDDAAMRAGKLGEDGRVIACAAAEMNDAITGVDVEQAEMKGPQAGLAVVQSLSRIENYQRIAIDVAGIVALGEELCTAGLDHPRTGPDEALARDSGKGGKYCRRGDAIDAAQLFGVKAPRGFDRIGFRRLHRVGRQRSD